MRHSQLKWSISKLLCFAEWKVLLSWQSSVLYERLLHFGELSFGTICMRLDVGLWKSSTPGEWCRQISFLSYTVTIRALCSKAGFLAMSRSSSPSMMVWAGAYSWNMGNSTGGGWCGPEDPAAIQALPAPAGLQEKVFRKIWHRGCGAHTKVGRYFFLFSMPGNCSFQPVVHFARVKNWGGRTMQWMDARKPRGSVHGNSFKR